MVVTGVANKWSFSEYWYGDNLQSVVPPASYFEVPPECNGAKVNFNSLVNLNLRLKPVVVAHLYDCIFVILLNSPSHGQNTKFVIKIKRNILAPVFK